MPATAEVSGVVLRHVTREVIGKVSQTITKIVQDPATQSFENVSEEREMKDPVIVFFPNKTCQVMPSALAERKGFLGMPEVLNLATVEDHSTPAGRYKNALRLEDRQAAWYEMETTLINRCISGSGHPLPIDTTYSKDSFYFEKKAKHIKELVE